MSHTQAPQAAYVVWQRGKQDSLIEAKFPKAEKTRLFLRASFPLLFRFPLLQSIYKGKDTPVSSFQEFPTAHRSLPYSFLKIHLPILKDIPIREGKEFLPHKQREETEERPSMSIPGG
jgi:hypothetical protein